jgi:hypothetical protein
MEESNLHVPRIGGKTDIVIKVTEPEYRKRRKVSINGT